MTSGAGGSTERGERETRDVPVADGIVRATVAWRSATGDGLCYFVPLEDGRPRSGDRRDRRARLGDGARLAEMDDGELERLWEEAVPLTATERRFRAPDGRVWLAQNVGPVWAEGDVAEGLTGILFTSLEDGLERVETGGGHVAQLDADGLDEAWRRASSGDAG